MKSQPTSTCLAESEDSLLPLDGLDLKPLDSATTNPTHKQSSKSIGLMSQSTETSKHSMERHIEESLFSQEDFPASRSVVPGSNEARTMTAISGRKCSESYKRQGQLGLLVRMLLESSAWHSNKCVLTWKRVDTKSSRSLFQLAVSMPRTEETESGLLPTPNARDWKDSTAQSSLNAIQNGRQQTLGRIVHIWPTPCATEGKDCGNKWETLARMWKGDRIQRFMAFHRLSETLQTSKATLNPSWVEWVMGYHIGHTALKDWVTPSCRKSHTKSSKA